MRCFSDDCIEAIGGSCHWVKIDNVTGAKVFIRSYDDADKWRERAFREAEITQRAAMVGVGPEVDDVEKVLFRDREHIAIVMERLVGTSSRHLRDEDPDAYYRLLNHADKRLRDVGIIYKDRDPRNFIIQEDVLRIIDYGPIKGKTWPEVLT